MILFARPFTMPRAARFKRKRRGLTLIEAALVLVVLSIFLGLIFAVYNNVSNQRELTSTKQLVQQVVSGVHSIYSGSTQYNTGSLTEAQMTEMLNRSGKIPKKYLAGSTVINTPYADAGGGVNKLTVEPQANTFVVKLENVPQGICQGLLGEYTNNKALVSAKVGSTTLVVSGSGTRLSAGSIATNCKGNKDIELTYR